MHELAPSWSEFITGLELYQEAILSGVVAGLVLGVLGIYIVLRRLVFVPLAVTHAAGLGVVLAFDAQIHLGKTLLTEPLVGAFALGLGATFLLGLRPARISTDSLVGMLYIVSAGLAVLVGAHISQESHEIGAVLFGTAVVVSRADFIATLASGALILLILLWLRRGLVFASFDREGARVQGLPVKFLDGALLLASGLIISITTRALGAMPVFAFAVLPALAALRLTSRIYLAFFFAGLIGAGSGALGYLIAFFLQFPVGATQAVTAAAFSALAMLSGKLR